MLCYLNLARFHFYIVSKLLLLASIFFDILQTADNFVLLLSVLQYDSQCSRLLFFNTLCATPLNLLKLLASLISSERRAFLCARFLALIASSHCLFQYGT